MAITTNSQIADFKVFFDAVSDGVTESSGNAYLPAIIPVPSSVPALVDLTVAIGAVRELVDALTRRLDSMQVFHADEEVATRSVSDTRAEIDARISAALLAERDESVAKLWKQMCETVDPLLEAERKLSLQAQERANELQSQLDSRTSAVAGMDMEVLRDLIRDAVRGNLGEQLLPQVELERSARVAAETRAEESSRRVEELQSNQRRNDVDLRRQVAEAYEPQLESERVRRAQCEERVCDLEQRLELNEQARRSAEVDLRDQSETLSILRNELAHLSEHKQQLERDSNQRNAATEHHEVLRLRLQAELDERNLAFEEARFAKTRLEGSLGEVELQLTQQKNENSVLGRTVDSLRIDFGKKLEERRKEAEAMGALETELRGSLQSSQAAVIAQKLNHAEILNELNAKLAIERGLNEATSIRLRQYETQSTTEYEKVKGSPAQAPDFLTALPKPVIRIAPSVGPAELDPPDKTLTSEAKGPNLVLTARVSSEAMAREKARLAILALGTASAPARLYFQSVPWAGLAVNSVSVDAAEFANAESSLASFAVATATQHAIDASHSMHSSNSSRVN